MAILVVILVCLALGVLVRKTKRIPLGTVTIVTGAVKSGKSTLSVWLALRSYWRALARWYILRVLPKHRNDEKPLLYSNIPLGVKHCPLTQEILLRKQRVAQKSVVLIDEASLVADSQLIRDQSINEQLLLFYKLYGHMSHGGSLIIDTQCVDDNHYAVKRVTSSYIYVDKSIKCLPLVLPMRVLQQRYSADGTTVAVDTTDIADITKTVLVPKFVWRLFDCYAYSVFTDHLTFPADEVKATSLKVKKVVSFRKTFENLGVENEKKEP